jgi:hypothetical protein
MRHAWMLCLVALAATVLVGPAGAKLAPGGFMSDNVSWIANIPLDDPGVGGRVVQVGDQTRFYVTGVQSLTIYDVTNPALPLPLGRLQLPNWENEDVSVSDDGNTVLVGNDLVGYSYVIDTSIVTAPRLAGLLPHVEHTISCADPHCNYAYGAYGQIFDIRDRTKPVMLTRKWVDGLGVDITRAHDFNLDAAGYLLADSKTRVMLDVTNPEDPKLAAVGPVPAEKKLAYQHNNIRPRAEEWQPRAAGDADPALRPGELLLAEGETNYQVVCNSGSGPFATWSLKDWDKGAQMTHLHTFRPVSGSYQDGNPAVNVLGCSGHWFTERDGRDGSITVAAGWYEHGTRFLRVDPAGGEITQVGYFQPLTGSTSGAYWIGDTGYVYTVDYARGIDILRFDEVVPVTTVTENDASWLSVPHSSVSSVAEAERLYCRLAAS